MSWALIAQDSQSYIKISSNMKTTTIAGKSVVLYDSIEELPIKRFHKYNKMLLIDAGIGGDLNAIDTHISRTIAFINTKKNEEAVKEMENIRQNIYMVMSDLSPQMLAFATLVYSIDGKPCDDLSDEALKAVADILSNGTTKEVTTPFGEVKKKIDNELLLYFPTFFDTSTNKEYYDKMLRYAMAVLRQIETGENTNANGLHDELLTHIKPKTFNGKNSAEIGHDKSFEEMCAIISQQMHADAKRYSVMEYYSALEHIQKQNNEQKKHRKAK